MLRLRNGVSIEVMPNIQVKDVPDAVHATLRRRAANAGMSLQEYLLAKLSEDAATPTLDELLDRAGGRAGGHVSIDTAVAAIRADREDR
jgi:antitoxin FitA